jgi:oxygen-independent coproporphyrinogen III oxidase
MAGRNKLKSATENTDTGLYVHIPFCTSKCAYCAFYSQPIHKHDAQRLMRAIHKELSQADITNIRTVYIGGGSPSCLNESLLIELVQDITDRSRGICEFTIECNPGQVSYFLLSQLRKLGVNRLSMGAQSFIDRELQILGRSHNAQAIEKAMYQAREAGFENISLDLIFAICNSTKDSWQISLDKAIALNPEHISAYSLTLEEGTPLSKAVEQGKYAAIDESSDRAMYEQAIDTLTKAGYEHYEISNFAKPGFRCRHNMGYWQNQPYIGIGPSAASSGGTLRTQNICDIEAYIEAIEAGRKAVVETVKVDRMDKICETAVLNLRTRDGIDIQLFKQVTGFDPVVLFAEPIKKHCEQGFLDIKKGRIALTDIALPVADYVLCDFAAID